MKQSDKGMLIVLESREVEETSSSSQGLVAALRDQLLIREQAKPESHWFYPSKTGLGFSSRTATLVLVSILLVISLAFGLRSALQIRQAEGSGGSISEVISGIFTAPEPESAGFSVAGGGTPTPEVTPESTLQSYGASFSWPDRFNDTELSRETESSKVLWPISTVISALVLGAWLYPRPDR